MSLASSAAQTTATQWMERTLDDSAIRRLTIPQSFLAVDAILILFRNVVDGLDVYPRIIERHLNEELPFMATEEILMAGVRAGGDRQELHERIRVHSVEAAKNVKQNGGHNDLMERLGADPKFANANLTAALDAKRFIGRAPEQVDAFINDIVGPIRKKYAAELGKTADELRV
jgi:adenylosuccinate lyase